jgi:SAM-dependent methyltransferase
MDSQQTNFLAEINEYYSTKLAIHGETAKGVDWNGEESQIIRFEQLSKIIKNKNSFSINDLGCGYGALYDYLRTEYDSFFYSGIDISEDMIQAATLRFKNMTNTHFYTSNEPQQVADYSIASGIFNVRLGHSDSEWLSYIEETIAMMDRFSRLGFAFNCLTLYSDKDKMKDYLYYVDPCALFDLCKRKYSPYVTLLHDYGLYEFTILVRKVL